MVPSIAWLTPPLACGEPVTVTGGHAAAHAPLHADFPPLSASKRYSVRPPPSTRAFPGTPEMACSEMVAELPAVEADEGAAGAEVVPDGPPVEPLPQAAASMLIPAAPMTATSRRLIKTP